MSEAEFNQAVDRRGTSSQKWERYKDRDVIPMWVADSDFMSPEPIRKALLERIGHGVFGYTNTPEQLNAIFIARMARLYGWTLSPESLVWLPGLVTGLHLACRSAAASGAGVATATPIYPPFKTAPTQSERRLIEVPMKLRGDRWLIDLEALERVADQAELLLFCNPHNPGGTAYRREELERLADIVIRHDLLICSDEIHCDLILEPGVSHTPIASLSAEIAARTITLMAPSKTWNIAGLGCSVAVIEDAALRNRFKQVRRGIVPEVNLLGYTAAIAAYEQCDAWNQAQCAYLRANRDLAIARINQMPGLKLQHFEATYLAWIDCSGAGLADPHQFFVDAGVGLSPGADFGDPNFVRMNLACTRATLTEALDRMERALHQLGH